MKKQVTLTAHARTRLRERGVDPRWIEETVLDPVRPEREAKAMTDITYDAEADAVYITVGGGKVDRTEETGPFIYDVDVAGRIVGIEILSASKVLASGAWKKARAPGKARVGAAE
jgi:uncharacterized protein YuzE